jgi:hypothetical protein
MNTFSTLIKTLLSAAVDCCILPGTANGAAILWIYTMQWKNEIRDLSFALFSAVSVIDAENGQVIAHHIDQSKNVS